MSSFGATTHDYNFVVEVRVIYWILRIYLIGKCDSAASIGDGLFLRAAS